MNIYQNDKQIVINTNLAVFPLIFPIQVSMFASSQQVVSYTFIKNSAQLKTFQGEN